ncbi:sugar transferase [Terribacillus saccharophilus]|uniref:sugar transferase n=1 Tax=Terribacillus saccharophilus TaxID=361277 RepID=UPI002989C54E|nr:sugar transferase [Terribacillus saccharophilus]MCM3225248.1 sugar transferase [Terribacillus saccharophilus]
MAESKPLLNSKEANVDNLVEKVKPTYLFTKRSMDVIFSLLGVIILLPVFIVISVLLKTENIKGDIFFKQKRVGINGREFKMYKFRSMIPDAEQMLDQLKNQNEASGPMFKMKNDPRITRIGRFLRKTSLDELPQLINVLKGEMSLVGPRPALPKEVREYNDYAQKRLSVQPGLTCYWQVMGRSNLGFEQQVELDIQYIRNRTILVDVVLIFKTIKVLFGSKGAY